MNIYPFASNHICDVQKLFYQMLSHTYSYTEIHTMFQRILEHFGYLTTQKNIHFNQSELILISQYIDDLLQKKPLAYILQYAYFFNLKFYVNPDVLIPRPETEELVWHLQKYIQNNFFAAHSQNNTHSDIQILDIGTGSGCIAVTLKKLFPVAHIVAIDISEKAIEVAKKNAMHHDVFVQFEVKDILKDDVSGLFDIIVSNPPYIPIDDVCHIDDNVKKYEPSIALFSNTSTEFYERILIISQSHLQSKGILLMELNQYYSQDVFRLAKQIGEWDEVKIIKDWSQNERFILCRKL